MLKIELSSCKEKNKEKKLRSFVIFFVYIVLSKGPAIIYFVTYQQKNNTLQGQWKYQCKDQKITNNLRDHPFKTSANFHDFWPLPPGPLPSAFQQNAYEGDFRSLCTLVCRIDVHLRLLILRKKFPLYGLIWVCMFIDFDKNFPPARLFWPARLMFFKNFPRTVPSSRTVLGLSKPE